MSRKAKIIITICVLFIVISLVIFNNFRNRVKYNEGYVNGNTTGNLYNAGLFCENNGTIFFANPDDNYKLYSMDNSGGDLTKLCDDTVMYINADDNYVYYVRDNSGKESEYSFFSFNKNSLCRISRKGGKVVILDEDPCIYASLIGNYIYYLHYDSKTATTLYKVGIDGKNREKLSDKYLFTCSTSDQYFFYNSPQDGCMYRYDTTTDESTMVYDCNCYKPIVSKDGNAYYIDVNNNNALVHTNIQSDNPITLTEDFIEIYNVYGSYIYYQRSGDEPALCMIKNDGTDFKVIALGEYTNINVTPYNIYFRDFFSGTMYYTSTTNPGPAVRFSPGKIEK